MCWEFSRIENFKSLAQVRAKLWSKLSACDRTIVMKSVLKRVVVRSDSVEIEISHDLLKSAVIGKEPAGDSGAKDRKILISCDIQVRSYGNEIQIIADCRGLDGKPQSQSLVKAIVRARKWYEMIVGGEVSSFEELAKQYRVTASYIRRVFRCAILAPETVESIITNRRTGMTMESLRRLATARLVRAAFISDKVWLYRVIQ